MGDILGMDPEVLAAAKGLVRKCQPDATPIQVSLAADKIAKYIMKVRAQRSSLARGEL